MQCQVEGAFSQPNGGMCAKMLAWAKRVTRGSGEHDLLELYCGNGNFTVALAPNFRCGSRPGIAHCRLSCWCLVLRQYPACEELKYKLLCRHPHSACGDPLLHPHCWLRAQEFMHIARFCTSVYSHA